MYVFQTSSKPQSSRRSVARSILERIGLVFLSVLIVSLLLEGSLRLVYSVPPLQAGRLDVRGLHQRSAIEELVWELKPSVDRSVPGMVVHINRDGLRDREYSLDKPSGVRRIAVLGDSVTFGFGVSQEEAYPKVLEQLLNQGTQTIKYEVMNFGVDGYNTDQEYIQLREKALSYSPDIVVLGFIMNDGQPTPKWEEIEPQNDAGDGGLIPFPGKRFVRQHSYLYQFLAVRLESIATRVGIMHTPVYYYDDIQGLVNLQRPEEETPNWKRARSSLENIVTRLRQRDIPLILVVFPSQNQLEDPGEDPEKKRMLDLRRIPQRRLREFASSKQIIHVDLLPDYDEWIKRQPLFVDTFSSHPNALGHRLAAEAILQSLRTHGLLGK